MISLKLIVPGLFFYLMVPQLVGNVRLIHQVPAEILKQAMQAGLKSACRE